MKKLLSITALMLVILVGVTMSGCREKYNFADDTVIVTLTHDASLASRLSGQPYSVADFTEIGAVNVEYIGGWDNTPQWVIDAPTYRAIYTITLSQKSHKNVLSAIKLLNERSDIQSASPNHIDTGGV